MLHDWYHPCAYFSLSREEGYGFVVNLPGAITK